ASFLHPFAVRRQRMRGLDLRSGLAAVAAIGHRAHRRLTGYLAGNVHGRDVPWESSVVAVDQPAAPSLARLRVPGAWHWGDWACHSLCGPLDIAPLHGRRWTWIWWNSPSGRGRGRVSSPADSSHGGHAAGGGALYSDHSRGHGL